MYNNNWWIIILILLFFGCGNYSFNGCCGNNCGCGCGCNNSCGNNCNCGSNSCDSSQRDRTPEKREARGLLFFCAQSRKNKPFLYRFLLTFAGYAVKYVQ